MTAGANQGYTNLVLSLLDAGDAAVLFRPYYFIHLMALQMTGSEIVTPASTPDLQPDLAALEAEIAASSAAAGGGQCTMPCASESTSVLPRSICCIWTMHGTSVDPMREDGAGADDIRRIAAWRRPPRMQDFQRVAAPAIASSSEMNRGRDGNPTRE